jgi:hypothetical protein
MTADQTLLNALDWCRQLDGQPTPQQIESVRQLVTIHLESKSINAAPPITAAELLLDGLLWSTHRFASAIGRQGESEWWAQEYATALEFWRKDRVAAEMLAHDGRVPASTLVALGAAEAGAEPLTAPALCDDTAAPPLLDYQRAFEAGLTGIGSQEPGHGVTFSG